MEMLEKKSVPSFEKERNNIIDEGDDTAATTSKPEENYDMALDCLLKDQEEEIEKGNHENGSISKAVEGVCPFVCGICSEKFDKVSIYYAHLQSHDNFNVITRMNNKSEMLEALNVKGKVNDNVFICGICQIEFPTMSLLHEHMVGEENVSDYHYSNIDHTAKPASRVDISQSVSRDEEDESLKGSMRNARSKGVKRKTLESSSAAAGVSKERSRNKEEIPIDDMAHTRSSQRKSSRHSSKCIDYKALAGIKSPKYDSYVENVKGVNVTSNEKKNMENSKIINEGVTEMIEKAKNKDSTNIEEDATSRKSTVISSKDENCDSNEEKELISSNIVSPVKQISETTNNDKEILKDKDDIEIMGKSEFEHLMKDDGTLVEIIPDPDVISDLLFDSDNDYNASEYDSDDDFQEEELIDLDDDINDPDFNDNEGKVVVLLNDTKDPEQYLKKFKVKKRIFKNSNDGQPVKNCLYPCAVCGRYYLWKALKKHMYAHVKDKVVQCTQCGKQYKSDRHLKDHIRSVHETKKFACPQCSSILKGHQSFEKHIMMHILKKEINDPLDEVEKKEVPEEDYINWKAQQKLLKGESYHKKKKKKKLSGGRGRKVIDLDLLKDGPLHGDHIVLEEDVVGSPKNQYCKICMRNFPTHESLLQHLIEHKDDEKFNCTTCKGFFQTSEHLKDHIINVHGDQELVCDICGEILRSSYALWAHKGKHLMKKDEYYSEEIVQKLQEEITKRKRKRRTHVPKNETKTCEVCGMVMLAMRYNRHLEVHNTTKDWECEICHNFYKTRRYLIDHMKKTHNAEKVTCNICGQRFKGKPYLEIHKQTHGPKDKHCRHCGKGFTTMMYLRTHLLTHEEKKRFQCDQCVAAFSHKQRLSIHMVEVHGEGASRPCKYCGDLFASRQKARRHERVVHEGFIAPTRIKKKPSYFTAAKVNEANDESLASKIIRLMPSRYVTVSPGKGRVPTSETAAVESNATSDTKKMNPSQEGSEAEGDEQFIKLENGEEMQVVIEKRGNAESLEFVELTDEQQNFIIQEADSIITKSEETGLEEENHNVEQILEIPENAEQCQILLYPDGTFKLLNVVDNSETS